jgi:hypothetical protein
VSEPKYKVLQIIDCEGWYAAFREDDGILYFDPLACWALLDIDEDGQKFQQVIGVRAADAASSEDYYPHAENFAGYCGPNDFSEIGVSLKQGVKPRNSWGS